MKRFGRSALAGFFPSGTLTLVLLCALLPVELLARETGSAIEIRPIRTSPPPVFVDARPGPPSRWVGEPVSLSLRNADLVEVVRSFAQLADFNLLVQPGVKGSVTVELKNVPWDQALSAILKMHDLGLDITRGTVRVGSPRDISQLAELEGRGDSLRDRQTVRGTLRHVDASRVAAVLNRPELGLLSASGHASARGQELTVAEVPVRLGRISRLVARLDVPEAPADEEALARWAVKLWPSVR